MDGMFMAVFRRKGWIWEESRPKMCRKICQRFVTRKPGHPPWGTQKRGNFWGLVDGLSVASRIEQCSGATEHPPNFRCQRPIPSSAGAFFQQTWPPQHGREFFFSLKIPSSAGRQDSKMPNMEPSFWGELFLSIALMAAMASRE